MKKVTVFLAIVAALAALAQTASAVQRVGKPYFKVVSATKEAHRGQVLLLRFRVENRSRQHRTVRGSVSSTPDGSLVILSGARFRNDMAPRSVSRIFAVRARVSSSARGGYWCSNLLIRARFNPGDGSRVKICVAVI